MSLYSKSKEIIYQDFLNKIFPKENSKVKTSLKNTKLEDLKIVLEEKIILKNYLEVVTHKNLFSKFSKNLYQSFSKKASLILEELPIKKIDIFAADLTTNEMHPIFTKNWMHNIQKKIVLNKSTILQIQQIERLNESKKNYFFELISPLTKSNWVKPYITWLPYPGNFHLCIILEMPLNTSFNPTNFALLKSILHPSFAEEMDNFEVEADWDKQENTNFLEGSKILFNFNKTGNIETYISRILNAFGYDAIIFLKRDDPLLPVYKPSSFLHFDESINNDAAFPLEDLLAQVNRQDLLNYLVNGKSEYRVHQCIFLNKEKICALLLQHNKKEVSNELNEIENEQLPMLRSLLKFALN